MSRHITLHPKYGVNPSVEICFWCQKETGVVLYGNKIKGEAPRTSYTSYDFCDDCTEEKAKGVSLIECQEDPVHLKQVPMKIEHGMVDVYPTGRWCVINEDGIRKIFDEAAAQSAISHRMACVEPDVWAHIAELFTLLGVTDFEGDNDDDSQKGDDSKLIN